MVSWECKAKALKYGLCRTCTFALVWNGTWKPGTSSAGPIQASKSLFSYFTHLKIAVGKLAVCKHLRAGMTNRTSPKKQPKTTATGDRLLTNMTSLPNPNEIIEVKIPMMSFTNTLS